MKKYIFFAAAAMMLASCSNDEPSVNTGNGEVKVTANLATSRMSRANGANWEADAIGVMVTGSTSGMDAKYKNVKYTTASTGSTADFAPAGNGIFFQNGSETVTFAAYAPYQTSSADNALPGDAADGVISASTAAQSTRDLQKAFDFLYASGATASRASSTVNFAFSHVMTKLTIVVKPGKDITLDDIKAGSFTLSGLKHDGSFNVTTGVAQTSGEAAADWSLNNNTIKSEGAEGVAFSAILFPQTLDAALGFAAAVDGQTYANSTIRPDLTAGNAYTYNVTVNKTGLTVGSCTVTDWNETPAVDTDAEMPIIYGNEVSAEDAVVGDIILSNGMFIKRSSITPAGKAQAAAVVFYVGHNENDNADYSETGIGQAKCHGYAVALQDATTEGCAWDNEPVEELGCYPETGSDDRLDLWRNPDIDWNGYNWTQKIINAAGGKDNLSPENNDNGFPATYHAVVGYQNIVKAPIGSSGWFLPSIGQLWKVYQNRSSLFEELSTGSEMEAKGYWSSTEENYYPRHLALYVSKLYGSDYTYKSDDIVYVRSILAY